MHQLLAYPALNLLGKSINIIERTTEALLDASNNVVLEVNTEKIVCLSHYKYVGENPNLFITNKSFKTVAKLERFGMMVTGSKLYSQIN
jgi:hypothetical protein